MKKLIALAVLSISLLAQPANPGALLLSESQTARLRNSQIPIDLLTAQLDAAKKAQENEILKIQLECGALPDKYEPLSLIDGNLGFKRKAEPQGAGKAVTP